MLPLFHSITIFLLIAASLLFAGCGASVPSLHWRDDANARFNTVISAGAEGFAPEETENIRQTLNLADRYFRSDMVDDANRLYQLSCQKTQLLYRNLIVSKIKVGTQLRVENVKSDKISDVIISEPPISIQNVLDMEDTQKQLDQVSEDIELLVKNHPDENKKSEEVKDIEAVAPILVKADIDKTVEAPLETLPKKSHLADEKHNLTLPSHKKISTKASIKMPFKNQLPQANKASKAGITLYLTFDDGPSRLTLPIASYLSSQGIKATFFVLGSNIKKRENVVSNVASMGHRVGNHTLSHNLNKLNASFSTADNEVHKTAVEINRLGGDGKMVRIPYGARNKKLETRIAAEGGQIFDWDINSNDSTRAGVKNHAVIEQTVIKYLRTSKKRHLILLFHDGAGHDSTLTAIKKLVPMLKQEGYSFGLLSAKQTVAANARKVGTP